MESDLVLRERAFHFSRLPNPVVVQQGFNDMAETGGAVWPSGDALANWLCELPRCSLPRSALELGAGTGLISIVLRLLGVPRVVATDGDPATCELCARNRARNGISKSSLLCSELVWGSASGSLRAQHRLDEIVAQVLGGPSAENVCDIIGGSEHGGAHIGAGHVDGASDGDDADVPMGWWVVCSDVLYDARSHGVLEQTLRELLRRSYCAKIVLAWQNRGMGESEFMQRLADLGEVETVWEAKTYVDGDPRSGGGEHCGGGNCNASDAGHGSGSGCGDGDGDGSGGGSGVGSGGGSGNGSGSCGDGSSDSDSDCDCDGRCLHLGISVLTPFAIHHPGDDDDGAPALGLSFQDPATKCAVAITPETEILDLAINLAPILYINMTQCVERRNAMEAMSKRCRSSVQLQRLEAVTPGSSSRVRELMAEFPGKGAGYIANAESHAAAWARIAAVQSGNTMGMVLEDDVVLHHEWRPMLMSALTEIVRSTSDGTAARAPTDVVDCFFLDCLFMTGFTSAIHGWLGPRDEGVHKADGAAFSDAYCLSPTAARWLLRRKDECPGSTAEAYLMQLSELRGATWTHMPRLALQTWDDDSLSGAASSMQRWYRRHYFPRFPRALYAFSPEKSS